MTNIEKIVQQEKNKKLNLSGVIKDCFGACVGLGACGISYFITYKALEEGKSNSAILVSLSGLGTIYGVAGIGSIVKLYESLKRCKEK